LRRFVEEGGSLTLFAGQIEQAWQSLAPFQPDLLAWFGLSQIGSRIRHEAGTAVRLAGESDVQDQELAFDSLLAELDPAARILATVQEKNQPLAYELTRGQGRLTVILVPYGINAEPVVEGIFAAPGGIMANAEDQPIVRPYRFLPFVLSILAGCFDREQIVRLTNPKLQYTVNLQTPNRLLLTVVNNTPGEQTFDLCVTGSVDFTLQPIAVPDVDRTNIGYYAPGYQEETAASAAQLGQSSLRIGPMDVAMFILESATPLFEARPRLARTSRTGKRYLRLDSSRSVQKQVNRLPTIEQHLRGISLDARYFLERSESVLADEGSWIKRHGLDVIMDCSGLFNNYPDWSQVDIVMERFSRTLQEFTTCLDRASAWGCSRVVIMLQRRIETGYNKDQVMDSLLRTMFYLADACKSRRMVLYLQNGTPVRLLPLMNDLAAWLKEKQIRSVRLALNVSHALMNSEGLASLLEKHGKEIGGLLISAPEQDYYGQMIDRHAPVASSAFSDTVSQWTRAAVDRCDLDFIILDSCYQDWNETWADLRQL
jgi:hypothetical protein